MPALKNAKHERVAQEIASGKTADEAYAAAGYKPDRGNASRLTANDSIKERIAEILNGAASRVEIDKSWVLAKLRQNAETCLAERRVKMSVKIARGEAPVELEMTQYDPAGANKALELLGKELGLFKDKIEHTGSVTIIAQDHDENL